MAPLSSMEFHQPGTPVDQGKLCSRPMHLPGAIQPTGMLLWARQADGGHKTQARGFDGYEDVVSR